MRNNLCCVFCSHDFGSFMLTPLQQLSQHQGYLSSPRLSRINNSELLQARLRTLKNKKLSDLAHFTCLHKVYCISVFFLKKDEPSYDSYVRSIYIVNYRYVYIMYPLAIYHHSSIPSWWHATCAVMHHAHTTGLSCQYTHKLSIGKCTACEICTIFYQVHEKSHF